MSWVTDTILVASVLEDEDGKGDWLGGVNEFFEHQKGFVSADWGLPELKWYGGSKGLQCAMAVGAFNDLQIDDLVIHLHGLKWEEPEQVQLILKDEHDERFRIIDVFGREGT